MRWISLAASAISSSCICRLARNNIVRIFVTAQVNRDVGEGKDSKKEGRVRSPRRREEESQCGRIGSCKRSKNHDRKKRPASRSNCKLWRLTTSSCSKRLWDGSKSWKGGSKKIAIIAVNPLPVMGCVAKPTACASPVAKKAEDKRATVGRRFVLPRGQIRSALIDPSTASSVERACRRWQGGWWNVGKFMICQKSSYK